MSINDPDSVFLAFEGFAKFIIDEKLKMRRTTTEVFLANEGLKTMKVDNKVTNNLAQMVKDGKEVKADGGGEDGTIKLGRASTRNAAEVQKAKKKGCK